MNSSQPVTDIEKSNSFGEKDLKYATKSAFDDYMVPDEKIESVVKYYGLLRKKFPHIKQERLIRKTCEHFHLKKGAEV